MRMQTAAWAVTAGLLAAAAAGSAQNVTQTLAQVNPALQAGQADKALSLLQSLPQGGASVGDAQNLACRVHYAEQIWDQAATECQQAVKLDGQNSVDHDWLGRAVGEKASHASFLTAYSLGKQSRSEFEAAVKLNGNNVDALVDVGNFYQQAPSIVGGGTDKAQAIAAQLDKLNPGQAHLLRANIAEGQKDYVTAEKELKSAIAASPHPADLWTNLAGFYQHRSRWTDFDSAIQSCETAAEKDSTAGLAFYDAAGVLIDAKRNPALAVKLLGEYIASGSKTEDGPLFEAHVRLATLKKQLRRRCRRAAGEGSGTATCP